MRNKLSFSCLFTMFFYCFIFSAIVVAEPSNKWRLEFSGKAHSDGEITIELTLVGGQKYTVTAKIVNGTSENKVAKTVAEVLKEQLPKDVFHVERDDGEDVLIKKRRRAADFDVKILSNTVEHVRINPDRE